MRHNKIVINLIVLSLITFFATACGGGGGRTEGQVEYPIYNSNLLSIKSPNIEGIYTTLNNPVTIKGGFQDDTAMDKAVTWTNYTSGKSGDVQKIYRRSGGCGPEPDSCSPPHYIWVCTPYVPGRWEVEIELLGGENVIEFYTLNQTLYLDENGQHSSRDGNQYDLDTIVIEHPVFHEPMLKSYHMWPISTAGAELTFVVESGGLPTEIVVRFDNQSEFTMDLLFEGLIPEDHQIREYSFTFTDLIPGSSYYYEITLTNSSGLKTTGTKSFNK